MGRALPPVIIDGELLRAALLSLLPLGLLQTQFAIGALVLGWFVLGLRTGWTLERRGERRAGSLPSSVALGCARSGRRRSA